MKLKPVLRRARAVWRQLVGVEAVLRPERHREKLIRLGRDYGTHTAAWTLVDDPGLQGGTIFSAGLGEDATFDLDMARRYGCRVIVIDPTPRAVAHFHKMLAADPRFTLVDKALWHDSEPLRLFAPRNPAHVSYSAVNFAQGYATDTPAITVPAVTMAELVATYGMPALLKMDIEGAEVEVALDMIGRRIVPRQVLVEYDEMMAPSPRSRERVARAHSALTGAGYRLIDRDRRFPANCLYVRG